MTNFSTAEENYIKCIYHLQQSNGSVTTNELAAMLRSKPASVTDMLKKLKAKKVLYYEPYKDFTLTAEGKKTALAVVRRHRLWEFFLAEVLQFGWDEVHEVAEELEHVSSNKLIEKLDAFLKYPRFDPHGDPIPDKNGKISMPQQICLSELPASTAATVSAVADQSSALLEVLKEKNVAIGTRLEVKKKFSFDDSVEVKIKNKTVTLSKQLAQVIYVSRVVN
ncbi:MAG TPA: metal-dependent transcriptional regulator [Chitinophagaceae bacterium]|nr:metal-dependent transcriptional regulator [Chitinophagaceae bacterium]